MSKDPEDSPLAGEQIQDLMDTARGDPAIDISSATGGLGMVHREGAMHLIEKSGAVMHGVLGLRKRCAGERVRLCKRALAA